MKMLRHINQCYIVRFEVLEGMDTLNTLKTGKSAGLDHLQDEHFKFANTTLSYLLCPMLFNTMVMRGYLPSKLTETIIVPITEEVHLSFPDN